MKYIVLIICLCNLFSFTVKAKERPTVITAKFSVISGIKFILIL